MKTLPVRKSVRKASAGMTLVELMVGMAVGLFVATVAIATFVSTRTLNVVNASTTRMSENARLAMDTLHTDLRNSGFAGCWPLALRKEPWPEVLKVSPDDGFIADGRVGVLGYKGDASGNFSPSPSAALLQRVAAANAGRMPVPESDFISVRVPADTLALDVIEQPLATGETAPKLNSTNLGALAAGDIALIADCKSATLFRVSGIDTATGLLSHDPGTGPLSNQTLDLGSAYGKGATVYRMHTRHYYVAESKVRAKTRSLWRLSVPPNPGEEEFVEVANGIDQMLVSYGVNTDKDQDVTRYVDASKVTAWERVVSARIQLLPTTPDTNVARVNQTYRFDGKDVVAKDLRLRNPLTEIVTLRTAAK